MPYASLDQSYDNIGITDDSNPNPISGFDGFDGHGTTFSAQGLATAGLSPGESVSADGLMFNWPDVPSAQPDNTMAEGQIVDVSGSGSKLGFLTSSNNSSLSGTGTVYYTDGTTSTFNLSIGNFWYQSGTNGNPSEYPGRRGQLRQLSDRIVRAHGVCVRAVGRDRPEQDRRGGRAAPARKRDRLQPGDAHLRALDRQLSRAGVRPAAR